MSVVREKAITIIEHCILQAIKAIREDDKDLCHMWTDRAYERIVFAWQLGMIELDVRNSYLCRIGLEDRDSGVENAS